MTTPIILYDNRFRDATPMATDTAAGYDVRQLCDERAYTAWKAASAGVKYVTVNCGSAQPVNALGMIAHNLASGAIDVSVESSPNGADWTQRFAPWRPTYDRAFLATFAEATAQYWRLKLAAGSAAPIIGEAYLGARLTFPEPPDPPFAPYTETVEADSALGKTGHLLGSLIRYKSLTIAPRWSNNRLARTFVHGDFLTFWDHHASDLRPFFWAWDLEVFPQHVFFAALKDGAQHAAPLSIYPLVDSLGMDMVAVKELVLTPASSPTYVPLTQVVPGVGGDYYSGEVSCAEGAISATVTHAALVGNYVPTVVATWNTTTFITAKADGSFTVTFNVPAPSGGKLYWSVIV